LSTDQLLLYTVAENNIGEVVVTGFSNKIMPFIRYKTGDLAIYGGTKNGVVYLKELIGRTSDYIYDKNYKKIFLVGLIFGGHIRAFNHIKKWQIIQKKIGFININIIKEATFSKEHENEIKDMFNSFNIEPYFNYCFDISISDNGKRKFLIQEVKSSN
jgi:phenylacetate-CoA ligase